MSSDFTFEGILTLEVPSGYIMNWQVPLADLAYDYEEEQAVLQVLKSRWLTMGAITAEFESEFANSLRVRHALAVSNATQALHLACLALGIGKGDEVILPSLTFVASANAVLYTGAEVRFADIIGARELTISAAEIEHLIGPKTKAIMVVHYGGYPCRMEEIMDVARRYKLAVIEDAAHAPGASLKGKSMGAWGDVGCFSFFSNKNISTGEGGMLVTNRDEIAERVRLLRSHGMTSLTWDRHQGHAYRYDVVELGYNYRIDEIRSALGRVQHKKLSNNNIRREEITNKYREVLRVTDLECPFMESEGVSAYHIFPILLPEGIDRGEFIKSMRERGVQTSIHYPPVHQFEYYRDRYPNLELPITEKVAAREVTLPLYPSMSDDQIRIVVSGVKSALNQSH